MKPELHNACALAVTLQSAITLCIQFLHIKGGSRAGDLTFSPQTLVVIKGIGHIYYVVLTRGMPAPPLPPSILLLTLIKPVNPGSLQAMHKSNIKKTHFSWLSCHAQWFSYICQYECLLQLYCLFELLWNGLFILTFWTETNGRPIVVWI